MQSDITLSQYLNDEIGTDRTPAEVVATIECLAKAATELADVISFSSATASNDDSLTANSDGDIQKPLDLIAQRIFEIRLSESPASMMISEELEDALPLMGNSSLCVALDPLDGSSNIETNMSIGSIFSIIEIDTGQKNNPVVAINNGRQLAAGFFVYGPQTTLAMSCGDGVNIFGLNPKTSEFVLLKSNVEIPGSKWEFAINSSNYRHWDSDIRQFVDDCMAGQDGPLGADFNMRWNASLVAEAYRILIRGGVFLYPGDSRPGYRNGRIRQLYEARPIAFMIEQAGGKSIDGFERILDRPVIDYHDRIPLIFGASDCVDLVEKYYATAPVN